MSGLECTIDGVVESLKETRARARRNSPKDPNLGCWWKRPVEFAEKEMQMQVIHRGSEEMWAMQGEDNFKVPLESAQRRVDPK